jgi:serine/threonine protein kinase
LLALLGPVCEVLEEAHEKGIIHRDLKPENIFLASGIKGRIVPKVLDFGIARVLDENTPGTNSAVVTGSPRYMPPEQWKGLKYADARSDQYSLGLIVYEALSGKSPFEADSMAGWVQQHCLGTPVPLADVAPLSLPKEFSDTVMRSFSREPSQRFANVASFLEALRDSATSIPGTIKSSNSASFLVPTPKGTPPPEPTGPPALVLHHSEEILRKSPPPSTSSDMTIREQTLTAASKSISLQEASINVETSDIVLIETSLQRPLLAQKESLKPVEDEDKSSSKATPPPKETPKTNRFWIGISSLSVVFLSGYFIYSNWNSNLPQSSQLSSSSSFLAEPTSNTILSAVLVEEEEKVDTIDFAPLQEEAPQDAPLPQSLEVEKKAIENIADVEVGANNNLDIDNDGLIGDKDKCPDVKGDKYKGGCPDTDNDGIIDVRDKCPEIKGVSPDGCPEVDSDKDGVPDSKDKCPESEEDANKIDPADGCVRTDTSVHENKSVSELIAEANSLFVLKKNVEAFELLTIASKKDPNNLNVYKEFVNKYQRSSQIEKACKSIRIYISLAGQSDSTSKLYLTYMKEHESIPACRW